MILIRLLQIITCKGELQNKHIKKYKKSTDNVKTMLIITYNLEITINENK